jgi:hypothetical protein
MPHIARLRTLLEYVERLPVEQIHMPWYKNECGTAACLMGHAVTGFPERFRWASSIKPRPEDRHIDFELYPGQHFFELSDSEWLKVFSADIPNHEAVSNLRESIKEWESAEHCQA